jgi:uncharacterized membrane protein YeaQ/YmgE (transglycosylase-associated protein family)
MGLIGWLIIGLIAGAIAKMITPQDEKGGWISSLVVGLIGSMIGGFLGRLTGISYIFGTGWFGSLIIAVLGAILVLFIYHKYLKEKLNVNL